MVKYVLGIDDSGRGPVIGPMILAGVLLRKKDEKKLKELRVRDSKLIAHSIRIKLAKEIKKIAISYKVIVISPREIDERASVGLNLNKIEAIKAADIINKLLDKLTKKSKKISVYIDCPSVNIIKWKSYLLQHVSVDLDAKNFFVEHKADVNHVACSAASIIAKVAREQEMDKLRKKYGKIGSGYPSDPLTRKFLQEYTKKYKKYGIFRETWQTMKREKATKEQKSLFEF